MLCCFFYQVQHHETSDYYSTEDPHGAYALEINAYNLKANLFIPLGLFRNLTQTYPTASRFVQKSTLTASSCMDLVFGVRPNCRTLEPFKVFKNCTSSREFQHPSVRYQQLFNLRMNAARETTSVYHLCFHSDTEHRAKILIVQQHFHVTPSPTTKV